MANDRVRIPRSAGAPIALIVLLGAALLINYVDRGTASMAAPRWRSELQLSYVQVGYILSAFFWGYVLLQPVMGWLADRYGAARVLAGGFLLWSIATFLTGFAAGFLTLIALRILMGCGESVTYPSALSILAQRIDDGHRARATSVFQLGGVVGPALGSFVGGWILLLFGWRAMFLSLGLLSLLWLIPWRKQLLAARAVTASASQPQGPALSQILGQPALWAMTLGNFCSNYAFYFVFSWLPTYLVDERGYSGASMVYVTTGFYVLDALGLLVTGWALDSWVNRGASPSRAYRTALALSAAGVGACLILTARSSTQGAIVLLLIAGALDGLNSPSVCSLVQQLAGPLATGRWMGVQNALSNVSGILAPIVTGYIVERTGHFDYALYAAGGVALVGLLSWLVLVPRVERIDWSVSSERSARAADPG